MAAVSGVKCGVEGGCSMALRQPTEGKWGRDGDRFCHQCLWDSTSSSVNCHQLEEAVNWCTYVSVK